MSLAATTASQPIVSTKQGKIQGNSTQDAYAFWKVPYAKQPIGNLRFKPPQPDDSITDLLDASSPPKPGDACIQVGVDKDFNLPDPSLGAFGREDCLTLDIYTSALDSEGNVIDTSNLKPVMFWITGGGGVFGGSYYFAANDDAAIEPTYDMRALVGSKDVVGVSINYRLGALGGLGLHALQNEEGSQGSTGNYAHQDVHMALRWVQDNIAKFGGDPSKVTIFGQSAGGRMVAWQLIMEQSKGLFSAAILESPDSPGTNDAKTVEEQETSFKMPGIWLGTSPADECCDSSADGSDSCVNINSTGFVECLRELPAESFATLVINGSPTIDHSPIGFSDTMLNSFRAGKGNRVPTIFGSNHFESLGGHAFDKANLFPYGLGVLGGLQACADSIEYDVEDDTFGRELITHCSSGPDFMAKATKVLADDLVWSKVLAQYPREHFETAQERWMLMMSHLAYQDDDGQMITSGLGPCHNKLLASAYAKFSKLPVHLYSFDGVGPIDLIQHSMEFALVLNWDNVNKTAMFMPAYKNVDESTYRQYVDLFTAYWTNFAQSAGNPNGDGLNGYGLPEWTPFSTGSEGQLELAMSRTLRGSLASSVHDAAWNVLLIGGDNTTELAHTTNSPYQPYCELWQDVMTKDEKSGVGLRSALVATPSMLFTLGYFLL